MYDPISDGSARIYLRGNDNSQHVTSQLLTIQPYFIFFDNRIIPYLQKTYSVPALYLSKSVVFPAE